MNMLTMDQIVQLIAIVMLAALVFSAWMGWRQIQSARQLPFFMLRRRRTAQGWRLILFGVIFGIVALIIQLFGRQAVYSIIPPTPSLTPTSTITPTPSITPTPTISPIPSITPTPTMTYTPTITPTPTLPEEISESIQSTVTPNPEAALSPIEVTRRLGDFNQPLDGSDIFELPIDILYAAFSYDQLQDGVQWSALWYLDTEILCEESIPWDGGTGGYGYSECELEDWMEGEYEIQMFIGEQWKVSTRFTVVRELSTETTTPENTQTP